MVERFGDIEKVTGSSPVPPTSFMRKIIFATDNKAKLDQINFIIDYFKFSIKIIEGREIFGGKAKYEEIGDTVDKVALNGALAVAKNIQLPVITEDTDFRIDALNGEPGIRAGEFLKNFRRNGILKKMEGVSNRNAVITSAVVYANPNGLTKVFINQIKGEISHSEKFGEFPSWIAPADDNLFGGGYNAIFIPEGWQKTLAEIGPEQAIPWSYREKNFIDIIKYLLKN